jgi:hypothetical protein
MRIIQFRDHRLGRRVGVVRGDDVYDVTAVRPEIARVVDAFAAAQGQGATLAEFLEPLAGSSRATRLPYARLLANRRIEEGPILRPPLDHVDPHRVLVSGTGLTHLGGMQARDQMHVLAAEDEATKSDSRKMFEMGLKGGKPPAGVRGAAPEWFYKGNGWVLRGHNEPLDVPPFALDGGEEPELVGCYVIDAHGAPRRLGFALGNEWTDHATEKINYLYLAPAKLRVCAVGPELVTDFDFQHVELRCTATRGGRVIYDSGVLLAGERNMCHSLDNCEDHHFKYPQHRMPGDVHLHFFGTSKLSHAERTWRYADGDEVRIEAPGFSASLVNTVRGEGAGTATQAAGPPVRKG